MFDSYAGFYRKVNLDRKVTFSSAFHRVYGLRLTAKLVHMHHAHSRKLMYNIDPQCVHAWVRSPLVTCNGS